MSEKVSHKQPAAEEKNLPLTLTEKTSIVVIIGYLISLIWLAGSSHWYGIW